MKRFGLIGYPLGHSFSKRYFTEKFTKLGLLDHAYELFEIGNIQLFEGLWQEHEDLVGLNVTVPYKEKVLKYVDHLDPSVIKVGAANVIKKTHNALTAYNTDYMAFYQSLTQWLPALQGEALVLGSGGASKAVKAALDDLQIPHRTVSRSLKSGDYTYEQLHEDQKMMSRYTLIINTTPLGTYPAVTECPAIPYAQLGPAHALYDLVYNPAETTCMRLARENGAQVKNGSEMLRLQAEKSWEIWNS